MITISFEDREKIGLKYVLDSLHPCSPFGTERVRKLRFFAQDEQAELETALDNTERAAKLIPFTTPKSSRRNPRNIKNAQRKFGNDLMLTIQ